jgi:hypothetical protein
VAVTARTGPRISLAVVGGIALIELLDETSFGMRLLGITPAPLPGGGELDGLHDLGVLAVRGLRSGEPLLVLAVAAGGALIAGGVVALVVVVARRGAGVRATLAAHTLVLAHVLLVGAAQLVDATTDAASFSPISLLEESLELGSAVVLAVALAELAARLPRRGEVPAPRSDRVRSMASGAGSHAVLERTRPRRVAE